MSGLNGWGLSPSTALQVRGDFSDDLPTRNVGVVVASRDPVAVRSKVDSLIEMAGFERFIGAPRELISFENGEPQPSGIWERKKDGHSAKVYVTRLVAWYQGGMTKNLTVRLPDELAADAEALARAEGQSVNETVKQALAEAVERRRNDPEFRARLRRIIEEDRALLERLAK